MKLPNAERAFVDIAKLRNYSLNPGHKEGKHKARVFAAALGLGIDDAEWLREKLLEAAKTEDCLPGRKTEYGQRYLVDFERITRQNQRGCAAVGLFGRGRIFLD